MLHRLLILLKIVVLHGLLVASAQDGAMTMNITLTTIVLNSLANILTVVVLNRLLVSCPWRRGSH